jgi:hypothetical protein
MKDYWQFGREGLNQFNFNYNYHDNPYFNVFENTNGQSLDRVYGNLSLTYQFADWLNLMVRSGTDFSNEFRDRRRAYSTQRFPLGSYREEKIFYEERNTDFLLSANKNLSETKYFNFFSRSFSKFKMRFYFVISSLRREIYKLKGAFNFVELLIKYTYESSYKKIDSLGICTHRF